MAEAHYHYNRGGQPVGPLTVVQLKALCDSGQLKPTDLVWREGSPDWVPAESIKGLFNAPSGAPTAAGTPAGPPLPPKVTPPRPTPGGAAPIPDAGRAGSPTSAAAAEFARQAAQAAKQASRQAVDAIKILIADPVGGLGRTHEALGPQRALVVGGVFYAGYLLCLVVAAVISQHPIENTLVLIPSISFEGWWKRLLISLVINAALIATLVAMTFLFRSMARRGGEFGGDLLIVGAALLPLGIAWLFISIFAAIFKGTWFPVALVSGTLIFGISLTVMLLFSGLTKIVRLSERAATIAVPMMLFAGLFVAMFLSWLFSPDARRLDFSSQMQPVQVAVVGEAVPADSCG